MHSIFFSIFACASFLFLEAKPRVDIVSYNRHLVPGEETYLQYSRIQKEFDVNFYVDLYKYADSFEGDSPELHKIIFIDYCLSPKLSEFPKEKFICFKWEAVKIAPEDYLPYAKVFTFDDDLVDGKKYFKFYYPVLQPMIKHIPAFKKRKLCSMAAGNWDPPERLQMLDFFATKPQGVFEFYGAAPEKYAKHPMYRGVIPGFSSSQKKLRTLKNYRFTICFENTHTTPGYITEKIFDSFAAGSIPVYWGPENVTDFIPDNCFIDYRNFKDNEEMYTFLCSLTDQQCDEYLQNIRNFLVSDAAYLFSADYFEKLLYGILKE